MRAAGQRPDPRDAQITRLKNEIDTLSRRVKDRDRALAELTDLNNETLSRLAAQHDEITRLRRHLNATSSVRPLPTRTPTTSSRATPDERETLTSDDDEQLPGQLNLLTGADTTATVHRLPTRASTNPPEDT